MHKITVRLHRQHDMDLIALCKTNGYQFGRELKRVLVAYANEEMYEPKTVDVVKFEATYVPTSLMFRVSLDERNEKEAKAIQLLTGIKNGYRNSFLKALFRSSMTFLPLVAFSKDNGFVMKRSGLDEFQKARIDGRKARQDAAEERNTPAANTKVETTPVTKSFESDNTHTEPTVTDNIATGNNAAKEDDEWRHDTTLTSPIPNSLESDNNDEDDDFSTLFNQMSALAH